MATSLEEMARKVRAHLIRNRSRMIAWSWTAGVCLVTTASLGLSVTSTLFVPWAIACGIAGRLADEAALFYAQTRI